MDAWAERQGGWREVRDCFLMLLIFLSVPLSVAAWALVVHP